MGKLGGSTRGAEHDSISVLSISVLLLLDGVRAGDEVRLMLRREARRGRTTKQLLLVAAVDVGVRSTPADNDSADSSMRAMPAG